MAKEIFKDSYYPIIYVRGYAMTEKEIEDTVATPYMGFNLGATKIRQDWEGNIQRHIFESPLIRLMKDHGYKDVYQYGKEIEGKIGRKSIIIYRYYEQASKSLGTGHVPTVEEAAAGLSELIATVRERVCGKDKEAKEQFKVHLVAHSMGGLVCRCFLQNPAVGKSDTKNLVDKVYTYATPHNGIEMAGVNVPKFLKLWDMDNFNRRNIGKYLALSKPKGRVDTLDGKFDPDRFFCLIGTNPKDYEAAGGISSMLAGDLSDGLVKIENAAVAQAPRAFVNRSHSGHYGIVNSEEGYQNLQRFLFGDVRVDGILEVENLPLPPSVQKKYDKGKKIRASYYFESTVTPRGEMNYKLTERRKETNSAVLRKFDELFRLEKAELSEARSPVLFTSFLDTKKIVSGSTIVFSVVLSVSTTEYEIDEVLFDKHIQGEVLFRNTLAIKAKKEENGWKVRYAMTDDDWGESKGSEVETDRSGMYIPLSSAKGFKGKLRLKVRAWK
jgi:hypothetical protein